MFAEEKPRGRFRKDPLKTLKAHPAFQGHKDAARGLNGKQSDGKQRVLRVLNKDAVARPEPRAQQNVAGAGYPPPDFGISKASFRIRKAQRVRLRTGVGVHSFYD